MDEHGKVVLCIFLFVTFYNFFTMHVDKDERVVKYIDSLIDEVD